MDTRIPRDQAKRYTEYLSSCFGIIRCMFVIFNMFYETYSYVVSSTRTRKFYKYDMQFWSSNNFDSVSCKIGLNLFKQIYAYINEHSLTKSHNSQS